MEDNSKANWIRFEEIIKDIIPERTSRWLHFVYTNDLVINEDIVYPDTKTKLRPGNGKEGIKMPGGPQYVVIHDTGMPKVFDNADGLNKYIHEQANMVDGRVASWHFSIDDSKVYQHVPTDEIAWHSGDGRRSFGEKVYNETSGKYDIGGGNQNGIGIETCINPDNDYDLTLKRTAKLVAMLLHQYNLGLDRIKQHYDFSSKNCPNIIRSTNGLWEFFLEECALQYQLLPLAIKMKWEVDRPDIVTPSGKIITPMIDTPVNIKLIATLNNEEKVYYFKTTILGISDNDKITKTFYELYLNVIPKTVSCNLDLPVFLPMYNTRLTWRSSHPEILDEHGKYNKPKEPTWITLYVTITIGELETVKEFNVQII